MYVVITYYIIFKYTTYYNIEITHIKIYKYNLYYKI